MMPSKKKRFNARFPPARIKKIMQKDEEVGKVAQAVPVIIGKALESFAERLLVAAAEVTRSRNARTLTLNHIKQAVLTETEFQFLRDLTQSIPDVNNAGDEPESSLASTTTVSMPATINNDNGTTISMTVPATAPVAAATSPILPTATATMNATSALMASASFNLYQQPPVSAGVIPIQVINSTINNNNNNNDNHHIPRSRGRPRKSPIIGVIQQQPSTSAMQKPPPKNGSRTSNTTTTGRKRKRKHRYVNAETDEEEEEEEDDDIDEEEMPNLEVDDEETEDDDTDNDEERKFQQPPPPSFPVGTSTITATTCQPAENDEDDYDNC